MHRRCLKECGGRHFDAMPLKIGSIIVFLLFLVSLNVLFLDIMVFTKSNNRESVSVIAEPQEETVSTCPAACTAKIDEVLSKATPTPAIEMSPITIPAAPQAAEFYIPLGSGTTKSSEYEELLGAEAHINTVSYPTIKKVTFEIFLRNPTGNGRVYAKLYNATDKHDVWFSEVFIEGGGLAKKEATVTLDSGNKLYRVMMKSTMKYDVYADTARIKIVTD